MATDMSRASTLNGGLRANGKTIGDSGSFTDRDEEDYSMGIQVIDENKEFTVNLPLYLQAQNLLLAGFSYHLVAVFGSQSTGKSTLLNFLFGTQFSVMDEAARKQTTKGIWMSRAEGEDGMGNNILVMDVEGTDGRERGEDQDFERKSALFALATSEVLIVNVWEHQVGLYQGANMGLLKTVFEVNLQLFQKNQTTSQRSLLFFVIRDHIGHTPVKALSEVLLTDLSRIWASLSKPAGLEDSKITDFFDFEFAALPHKILQADRFVEETRKLRKRFREVENQEKLLSSGLNVKVNESAEDDQGGVFLPAYHRRIPADGFPMYAEGIWNQIMTNKDLDLPTQQELLAQYRCDEISAVAILKFDSVIVPFENQSRAGKGVLEGLGEAMKKARNNVLKEFDEQAGRYHKGVFKRKREELIGKIDARLKALVVVQLAELHKRAVKCFEEEVLNLLKSGKAANVPNGNAISGISAAYDFRSIVDNVMGRTVEVFEKEASELVLPPESSSGWAGYEVEELDALKEDLEIVAARLRAEEMKRLVGRLERALKTKLGEGVGLSFNKMANNRDSGDGESLWDGVWKCFEREVNEAVKIFTRKAEGLNAGAGEIRAGIWRLKKKGWGVLRGRIDEEVGEGNLLMKLRENFEDRFRYDENGIPKVWKPSDDIESQYARAREATMKLIPLVSHIRLSSTGEEPPLSDFLGSIPSEVDEVDEEDVSATSTTDFIVLTEAKQVEIQTKFKRTADALYVEAKRSTISSVAQIPLYFYGLLLAFGWNEIWMVLRNPLYFMFTLILGVIAYVIYALNLWGPVLRVTNAMAGQVSEIAKERLRDFVDSTKSPSKREHEAIMRQRQRDVDEISLQTLDQAGRTRNMNLKQEDEEEESW